MPQLCKLCIMEKGLKGIELKERAIEGEQAMADHMEKVHHVPVQREGETPDQTLERFHRENPEAGTASCKCPFCRAGYAHRMMFGGR